MNILIVEENRFTALQYRRLLEKNGHSVVVAQDGQECLEKYSKDLKKESASNDSQFDIVVLDHGIPNKTGENAVKKILAKNPNQKILFVTGYQRWAVEDETDDLVDKITILEKPFTSLQFERKIASLA